jgi:hypothetical protein
MWRLLVVIKFRKKGGFVQRQSENSKLFMNDKDTAKVIFNSDTTENMDDWLRECTVDNDKISAPKVNLSYEHKEAVASRIMSLNCDKHLWRMCMWD